MNEIVVSRYSLKTLENIASAEILEFPVAQQGTQEPALSSLCRRISSFERERGTRCRRQKESTNLDNGVHFPLE